MKIVTHIKMKVVTVGFRVKVVTIKKMKVMTLEMIMEVITYWLPKVF